MGSALLRVLPPLVLLAACSMPGAQPGFSGRTVALVYGIADYVTGEDSVLDLAFTDDDAVLVASRLEDAGYEVMLRLDEEASLSAFRADLSALAQPGDGLAAGDRLLIYFAGHGWQLADSFSSGSEPGFRSDAADEVLFFHGSLSGGGIQLDGTGVDLSQTLTDDQLASELAVLPVRPLLILDACNTGGLIGERRTVSLHAPRGSSFTGRRVTGARALADALQAWALTETVDLQPTDAAVLSAAGETELAWESASIGQGWFTAGLAEALADPAAADRFPDGALTLTELYRYTRDYLDRTWNAQAMTGERYRPRLMTGPSDPVVLFY